MPGMALSDLVTDLKAALGKAVDRFTDPGDFERQLRHAASDLARKRPRTLLGTLTLEAGRGDYPAPPDLVSVKVALWGQPQRRRIRPWDPGYPRLLPHAGVAETSSGLLVTIDPAPSAAQIDALGSEYRYYYYAAHSLGATEAETTVREADRALLLLRAMAEAMRELAASNVVQPIQLHRGIGSVPASGTPQAVADQLMAAFEREAA